jgi:1-aminocyclopropane-1-carboxylate deaminase/D-cysteine desulfhydrase-like pyridoxal-dependent ACC family enzyme
MENPLLQAARRFGMQLCQVSRATYRDKALALSEIQARAGMADLAWQDVLVIPEGGAGPEGLVGFHDLIDGWCAQSFIPRAVLHASATATTAVGLALALARAGMETQVLAVPVLHNLPEQQALAKAHGVLPRLRWITGHEAGGYARTTPKLRAFCQDFTRRHRLSCEPIYTGKALHALCHLIAAAQIQTEGLVFLHTGGLPDLHQA